MSLSQNEPQSATLPEKSYDLRGLDEMDKAVMMNRSLPHMLILVVLVFATIAFIVISLFVAIETAIIMVGSAVTISLVWIIIWYQAERSRLRKETVVTRRRPFRHDEASRLNDIWAAYSYPVSDKPEPFDAVRFERPPIVNDRVVRLTVFDLNDEQTFRLQRKMLDDEQLSDLMASLKVQLEEDPKDRNAHWMIAVINSVKLRVNTHAAAA